MIQFKWFCFGYVAAMIKCCTIMHLNRLDRRESDEIWCGCDGMGMAHAPGASGFQCARIFIDQHKTKTCKKLLNDWCADHQSFSCSSELSGEEKS